MGELKRVKKASCRKKRRAVKGEVSVNNVQGMIVLRWSFGTRYSLSIGFRYKKCNLPCARKLAKRIQADMIEGRFDDSLISYRIKPKRAARTKVHVFSTGEVSAAGMPEVSVSLPVADTKGLQAPVIEQAAQSPVISSIHQLTGLFEKWVTQIRKRSFERSSSLKSMRSKLAKWVNVPLMHFAAALDEENLSKRTSDDYLYNYRTFLDWCLHTHQISFNPLYQVLKSRKMREATPEERKPLSADQIRAVMAAIKNNRFGKHHSRYYPFLYFIFSTGARNAEAVGLRISNVDFEKRTVTICETLARGEHGSHDKARIRKDTKTGNTRILPMNGQLYELLLPLCEGRAGDDLVFLSPTGRCIDDAHVLKTVFSVVLAGLNISYRVLYVARKSMATRAIREGMNVTDLAYYLGHATIDTTIKYYIEVERSTVPLPVI